MVLGIKQVISSHDRRERLSCLLPHQNYYDHMEGLAIQHLARVQNFQMQLIHHDYR